MEVGIHLHGILLNQLAGSLEVPFTLDTLYLCQQTGKELAQLLIVGNLHISLSVPFHQLDDITLLVTPMGYERPVPHVGLFYLMTRLYADELCHQSIHDIGIILRLIGILVRDKSQFDQFLISDIVQSEQVGTSLFYRVAIGFQGIRVRTG